MAKKTVSDFTVERDSIVLHPTYIKIGANVVEQLGFLDAPGFCSVVRRGNNFVMRFYATQQRDGIEICGPYSGCLVLDDAGYLKSKGVIRTHQTHLLQFRIEAYGRGKSRKLQIVAEIPQNHKTIPIDRIQGERSIGCEVGHQEDYDDLYSDLQKIAKEKPQNDLAALLQIKATLLLPGGSTLVCEGQPHSLSKFIVGVFESPALCRIEEPGRQEGTDE